ncbi:SAV2148 family HEPN domain-containing protein [Streptomyces sp. DSM 44915]|uniref:SAV2148 family HEPN domain-containing protein n=1 Tax=Streptomyces chisholmiae TaxID=3075540 RepID=A0ABU2JMV4_9ACTN|nr:SAV2148 family HEPN domain-containing protein [Streptomyces sp. DSM 44915]MDT0266307.1 SAV2148 family HEPN domain-containing protein [Streptomyces sp. DSM 44915]
MGSSGLELPSGNGGEAAEAAAGAVPVPRPMEIGADLEWSAEDWSEVRLRVERAGRAYVWLNLVEQRLRSVVGAVLRPVYEPVHGPEWEMAAAGPTGQEWVQRAAALREVSRRKGHLLDPADDTVLAFLTLPQLRELMVQHWPCFAPYFDNRRELELTLDELEVARSAVSRNRGINRAVLEQAERGCARLLRLLDSGAPPADGRLPADVVEQLVGDRFTDVAGVHPDRVRLQRQLPAEELFGGARRLDAMGIGLGLLVQNYPGRRLMRLAEAGCRTRLLFLNPASAAMRRRERELGLKRGELGRSVETNILQVRRVRARVRDQEAFEIRVFDETPRFSAYFVDGDGADGVAVIQSYLRRSRGVETPALVLRRAGREILGGDAPPGDELSLFETYHEEFEWAWGHSRPVS